MLRSLPADNERIKHDIYQGAMSFETCTTPGLNPDIFNAHCGCEASGAQMSVFCTNSFL